MPRFVFKTFWSVLTLLHISATTPVVPVPLLDHENAPLIANLDMTNVKSFISYEVEKEIMTLLNDTVSELVDARLNLLLKDVIDIKKIIEHNIEGYNVSDCAGLKGKVKTSGVQLIQPKGPPGYEVYCDMETDGGGWTVFHRRYNGEVNFHDKLWNDYKNGFGNVSQEHWLGNDRLHDLTLLGNTVLRVDLGDWENNKRHAVYNQFVVGDAASKYRLTISGYTGNAGNSMGNNNRQKFTTVDNQNDGRSYGDNCAGPNVYGGSWWYGSGCGYADLNGKYVNGGISKTANVMWYHWEKFTSLKTTKMMVRRP